MKSRMGSSKCLLASLAAGLAIVLLPTVVTAHESGDPAHAEEHKQESTTTTPGVSSQNSSRQEIKIRINQKRTEVKTEVEQKTSELRQKLDSIRDPRKQKLATKLSDQLEKINERYTKHYLNYLDHLENVLGKIEDRVEKKKDKGVDVAAAEEAIEAAYEKIEEANEKVIEQRDKVYSVSTDSEDQLGQQFGDAVSQMKSDHKELRKYLHDTVRKAVKDAFTIMKGLKESEEAGNE